MRRKKIKTLSSFVKKMRDDLNNLFPDTDSEPDSCKLLREAYEKGCEERRRPDYEMKVEMYYLGVKEDSEKEACILCKMKPNKQNLVYEPK